MRRTSSSRLQKPKATSNIGGLDRMRRASIILAVLATTLAGRAPLAQAQESSAPPAQAQESGAPQLQAQEINAPQVQAQESSAPQAQAKKGPTLGGHIGF